MEKVKIFTAGTPNTFDEFELEVNEWLAENGENIEIVSRHVTNTGVTDIAGRCCLNCTITIFYRPVTK